MKRSIPFLPIIALTCLTAKAQMNIGSNIAPDSSAMLQISGTAKGFLPPRMTQNDMLLIRKPVKGLMVFNTTDSAVYMRRDSGWTALGFGNVRSASVVPANGVSGSVSNASTTPAITLTLNNITPASVAAIGAVTGSNLSGTNTGDETNVTLKAKLGAASGLTDGYLTQADWITFNNKPNAASVWNITGNVGTSYTSSFVGTTDSKSLRFRTNNIQRFIMDSLGNIGIGDSPGFTAGPNTEKFLIDAGTTTSYNLMGARGSYNNYLQFNISNQSSGSSASTDIVATADNGSETKNFIDMGINSSGFGGTGAVGGPGTAYLYSTGNDLAIGNGTPNKSVVFFTGGLSTGDYTERFRLDASGRVGIGTSTPTSDLSVSQSTGTGGSRGITLTGNSIGGTSAGNGFLLTLGYNAAGNKQLWLGDPDYANNSAGTFVRYISSSGYSYFDGINGTNTVRKPIGVGYGGDQVNSGVILGADENALHPGSYVWSNGNMTVGTGYRSNAAPADGLLVQGKVGIGQTSPTATLHLKAGTALANTAPLKLTSGTNTTAPEDGAIEFDGTNYYATSGGTRCILTRTLTATASLAFLATLPNSSSSATTTISVPGAAAGDAVSIGIPAANGNANGSYIAYVSAANTVTVKFNNTTTLSLTPATGTFRVTVMKY